MLFPEKFGLKDSRQTKQSDCYALGMVIYEVLSGRVPLSRYHGYAVAVRIHEGERPMRPRGEGGMWFTDDLWSILERCWKASPCDRPSIKEVFQCLEEVSKSWTPLSPRTLAGPPTVNSSARSFESSTEAYTNEGEVSSPSEPVSSQPSQELPLKGDPNRNRAYPSAHEFSVLPCDAPNYQNLGTSATNSNMSDEPARSLNEVS